MIANELLDFTEDEREYIAEQLGPGGIASLVGLTEDEQVTECRRILNERDDRHE